MLIHGDLTGTGIRVTPEEDALREHTKIKPLAATRELERIPFSRSRAVDLDWDEIIAADDVTKPTTPYLTGQGMEFLRRQLEKSWGISGQVTNDIQVQRIEKEFVQNSDNTLVIFKVPPAGRLFKVSIAPNSEYGVPLTRPVFKAIADYEMFWKHAEQVSYADNHLTELSYVDLAPAIIYRQYRELKALRILGDSLATSADKIAAREYTSFVSAAELDELTKNYLQMRNVKTDVETKLERLKDKAQDLGYYLALEKETIIHSPTEKDELEAGQIYQPYRTDVKWQTLHYRNEIKRVRFLFGRLSWSVRVPYYEQHLKLVTRYRKIVPDFDPWVEAERELTASGFTPFRFERTGSRYLTAQGESIEQIVERCEANIEFGKRAAVLVPMYEQSLLGNEILSKYIVIKRPRRGIQPVHLPQLFIEEDLLFATHFRSVEVGELVESINLAPGENREIVIEKTRLAEEETRRTTTSISDLTESDKVDLSTEMERESSRSKENSTTKSLSAKAGGSYGPFSASASGSTSSTSTTREFTRDLQKVANKASRSVTRQTRQEVSTTASTKTSVSSRESTKIVLENINDGRAINLLFYQLYNIFEVSLRLERLSFTLLSGREIIAGTGIVLPEVYPMEQLGAAIERMSVDGFPIKPNAIAFPAPMDASEKASAKYQILVVQAIKDTLNEYRDDKPDSSSSIQIASNWDAPPNSGPEEHVRILVKALAAVRYTSKGIVPPGAAANETTTLVVGSPGLYLDTNIGARPATEPYSEEMRTAELEKKRAEVQEILARAAFDEAMARRTSRYAPYTVKATSPNDKTLKLEFSQQPARGKWDLWVEEVLVTELTINTQSGTHNFATPQGWLTTNRADLCRIVHKETSVELYFLI